MIFAENRTGQGEYKRCGWLYLPKVCSLGIHDHDNVYLRDLLQHLVHVLEYVRNVKLVGAVSKRISADVDNGQGPK